KVVTAAAALESGLVPSIEDQVAAPRVLELNANTTLPNFNGESCGGSGTTTLIDALTTSCNTAFGQLGIDLNDASDDALRSQAEAFGLNGTLDDFPLPQARSIFPTELDDSQSALSAIGQFSVAVTPLQMAEIAATIGNGGTRMQPYLVESYRGPDGNQISRTEPEEIGQAVDRATAAELTTMMASVVSSGTGTAARVGDTPVAGKTGTAEFGTEGRAHAWFIGFAPAVNPK
nr:penicillin-binding transpeptidase domain-containing protein [Micromonospora sp. DSM 115978]